jgi:hypothetical protein
VKASRPLTFRKTSAQAECSTAAGDDTRDIIVRERVVAAHIELSDS